MPNPAIDRSDFDRRIHALKVQLEDLIEAASEMRQANGWRPAHDSPAIAEIADEACLAGSWGSHPVEEAHSLPLVVLAAADDHFNAMCHVLGGSRVVYGHVTLARGGVEACARSAWLSEPGLGARRRVARAQTERLYSLHELVRVGVNREHAKRRIQMILDQADLVGMERIRRGREAQSLMERRPGTTDAVSRLFGGDRSRGFGRLIFQTWSAVAHGTLYGLLRNVDPVEDPAPGSSTRLGQLYANSGDVNMVLAAATWAYILSVESARSLYGWSDERWERSHRNAVEVVRLHVRSSPALDTETRGPNVPSS